MTSSESDTKNDVARDLIVKCQHGDRNAFRSLVESQHAYAYALAFRLLRNEDRARDVIQEAFIQVWKHLGNYRNEIKFTTWLYKIVVHRCYDMMKMESRRKGALGFFTMFTDSDDIADEKDAHADLEKSELCDQILSLARRLPPKERLVFHLRDVHDFSIEEVAEYANISAGAVKTHLSHARKRIRTALLRLQERESS